MTFSQVWVVDRLIFVAYYIYLLHIRNMISVVLLILMFNSAHFAKMIAKLLQ